MDNFKQLGNKLEAFIRRFYLNELLKGAIFFVSIGLVYFILTLTLEHFLWLSTFGRQILFWSFVLVELALFGRFILFPLLKLLKLSKGIDYVQASRIIGNHFPEVRDKLLNLLQLKDNSRQSELLLAGIDQKARELKPVPFDLAVDFRRTLPFLKYMAIPVIILLLIVFTGNTNVFADSYERVVHYKKAYAPPAPFAFEVMNESLETRANEPFKIQVRVVGNIMPENPSIHYEGQTYFLNRISPGLFEYEFESLNEAVEFYLSGNQVTSDRFKVRVMEVPVLRNFRMNLVFPSYTGLGEEVHEGSGNATVPEGTVIKWQLKTAATDEVAFEYRDSTNQFVKDGILFSLEKQVLENMEYQISTSNQEVRNYETLSYSIGVIKDEHPELELEKKADSLESEAQFFFGKVSDDYEISGVSLVYYPADEPEKKKRNSIPITKSGYAEFFYSFPDTLKLEEGRSYEFYFQAFDNDALKGPKSVKSRIFNFRKKTTDERKQERIGQQGEAIQALDRSLENMQISEKELEAIDRLQKQKEKLNYSDRKKLENFLERQKKQNALMKEYTEKLKRSLSEEEPQDKNELNEELQERIKRKEERLEENEELLEELKKYGEKISQEELGEKLEKLSKNNQNQERSLEQLLELTKKYYVEEKAAKISRDLENLAGEQEELSQKGGENTKEAQEALNEKFEELQKEMGELEEENKTLKKPGDTGADEELKQEIKEEQENAGENLQNQKKEDAEKNQKKAAEKMRELSAKMKKQQQMSAGEQMQEDAQVLRKILDNLIVFSFEQEDLMEDFSELGRDNPAFAGKLRKQNVLKEHFQHVDDSLYSLALRNPMVSEKILSKLTDIEFDLDKSLERIAENQVSKGMASQQYVVTGANDLAYLLSEILGNMQNMMSSSGGGGAGEMQLPDIIKKQEELNNEMQEGLQKKRENEGGQEQGKNGKEEGEKESGELFRIFQEQQKLRQILEERLKESGVQESGEALKDEMEKIEEELLREGFDEKTLERMQNLEHKLLELEEAEMEQGKRPERESNTNTLEFENTSQDQILRAKEYFNTTEILNRQTLPLRQIYKRKVKEYFERGDH